MVTATNQAIPKNALDERLSSRERAALTVFIDHLRQHYGDCLLRVVLFGSKARGDLDGESELNVVVVVRAQDDWRCRDEITDLTSRLLLDTGVNISALVRADTHCAGLETRHAPIYNSIQRDGVELWTMPSESSLPSA